MAFLLALKEYFFLAFSRNIVHCYLQAFVGYEEAFTRRINACWRFEKHKFSRPLYLPLTESRSLIIRWLVRCILLHSTSSIAISFSPRESSHNSTQSSSCTSESRNSLRSSSSSLLPEENSNSSLQSSSSSLMHPLALTVISAYITLQSNRLI